jgi:hypothetical protein
MLCPDSFTTGNDPAATVEGTEWAPGPICMNAETLTPAWILSPGCPAHTDHAILALKIYSKPKLNVLYIISVFLAVNEFLNFTTTVKQKVVSLF